MFAHFFHELKRSGIPVSMREYLTLLEAMQARIPERRVEQFYYLSRAALVKDERNLDKFDRVFSHVFKGLDTLSGLDNAQIPEDWLKALAEKFLTDQEKKDIEAMGGWDKLMETLKQRLAEQKKRHEGGNKMIGTAGTSPYGTDGYNPEGVQIGKKKKGQGKALKVWERREYRNLDDQMEIGTRNIKIALRRLRRFAREGAPEILDLPNTIHSTAKQGYLDIKLIAERRNMVKVLLFLDIGGSMDSHVKLCAELFSASRAEFKTLEYFYFHNCVYEEVWRNNRRRHSETIPTWEVLRSYPSDYKVVFVGDASMSPYEITHPGGSVEHWNDEAGALWLQRVLDIYPGCAWLNPVPERHWGHMPSVQMIGQIFGDRMYPLTLDGLDKAMHELARA